MNPDPHNPEFFPIIKSGSRDGARRLEDKISFRWVLEHQSQAVHNHGQSVHRLAQRGGLSWLELWGVVSGQCPFELMRKGYTDATCMPKVKQQMEWWKAQRLVTAAVGDGAEIIGGGFRKSPTCRD
ncbi:hypothetical protein [Cupriavidus sp. CuC1]|uniref:hypothetical protein n=1 Tax=Cupriavidus sp. CuC1 TaxID=3373131 RepID=UPI0037D8C284